MIVLLAITMPNFNQILTDLITKIHVEGDRGFVKLDMKKGTNRMSLTLLGDRIDIRNCSDNEENGIGFTIYIKISN